MNKIIFVALLFIIGGCSPEIRVYSDHDPDYDLKKYTSFDWAQKENIELGSNPLYYNELNDKRIKLAVKEQLTSKGYVLAEKNPDLIVHYHIIVDDQSVVVTDPHGYFYSSYWMHLRTNVYQYREGTLVIDLMEPHTGNLVWRGWAVSALEPGVYTPDQIGNLIKIAVVKIFKKFPKKDGYFKQAENIVLN